MFVGSVRHLLPTRGRKRRTYVFLLPLLLALAVLATLAVRPDLTTRDRGAPVADSYDGFDPKGADQLRQDQCLMAEVLRMGGPSMFATAQEALGQSPDKLRVAANRDYWEGTPLSKAFAKDETAAGKKADELDKRADVWEEPLDGLPTPAGFTETGFHWAPDGEKSFFNQVGYLSWISEQFWKDQEGFYDDPTSKAGKTEAAKVRELGGPLYGKAPDSSLPTEEWQKAYAEHEAWEALTQGTFRPLSADDARLFLTTGGFTRVASEEGSLPFRVAVEDLKTRFGACAWRGPFDPSRVLGKEVATASKEWQEEIASQATQRDDILNANKETTQALSTGSQALGEMLGQSWTADHLTRWQNYWSLGGPGAIGDSPMVVYVHDAQGKCLDVQGGGKANGTPVQLYTCNGSPAQKWQIDGERLRNVNSGKCLDVKGASTANGAAAHIWRCNGSAAQKWQYTTRGTSTLKNVGTGNCLDLPKYENGSNARLWDCSGTGHQKFDVKPSGNNGTGDLDYPTKPQFAQAKKGIADAEEEAKRQLGVLNAQLVIASKAAARTEVAKRQSYKVADSHGAPRGRGLIVGEQKAQVTQASFAALQAMVEAGKTAYQATKASAADSATIADRARAQAGAVKAQFRNAAAKEAEQQAKAAAEGAAEQEKIAKEARNTARAKLTETEDAEADAKAAAATAHAKRVAAEKEEATAKAEKLTAAAKQAEASKHKTSAQEHATKAKDAKDKAESAASTAATKRKSAEEASDKAREARDDAWDAEQKADSKRAKADAKEAYAQAHDASDDAKDAREAADAADAAADKAESEAGKARADADAATKAAAEADAAATRAEAAAKRARSDSDAAQAAKLKADAAVKTATSAAADAISAAGVAATAAKTAVELADKAEEQAKTAKSNADAAKKEAAKAISASADAAGHAYVTAQAAVAAGHSAQQVAAPANDAIQLGSPYITRDAAAGLAVLTGQASKTIAEQQRDVAQAHADNAEENAKQAESLANAATGDAKAAYVWAAKAAGHAADARKSAKNAITYAAEAADAASKAAASLARTIDYDRQATEDAAAADRAATRAENHAKDARDSADQAALDAEAAREAAAQAEAAAKEARQAADQAAEDAAAAEQAAKDAQRYADEAQQAAEEAARKKANKQVKDGAGTGIGNAFYVVDGIELSGDPKQLNDCVIDIGLGGCSVDFKVTFDATVDFYLCTNPEVPATKAGCPSKDTAFLGTQTFKGLSKKITRNFTKLEILEGIAKVIAKFAYDLLIKDFVDCWHGSADGCAWAAANFLPGKKIEDAVRAISRLDRALKSGDDIAGAWDGLRGAGLSDEAVEGIGSKLLDGFVKACTRTGIRASAARSSDPCAGMIVYGSTDLSRMAYKARTAAGFTSGRNVAVARVPGWNDPKTGDLVVGFSKGGGYHSENHILDQLAAKDVKPTKITEFYTERSPCSACGPLLEDKLAAGTPISWSVPEGPGSSDLLYRMIRGFGGRKLAPQSGDQ
ncbi:virulence factor [Streptomyces spectabilis]|uniref:Virulence factor n=1 Tax=Streptomyces spectabilis TaxID=68270 RepID=A0A516RFM6_STRST|nr:virulence factor [Streptomyces spectabilis]